MCRLFIHSFLEFLSIGHCILGALLSAEVITAKYSVGKGVLLLTWGEALVRLPQSPAHFRFLSHFQETLVLFRPQFEDLYFTSEKTETTVVK